MERWHRRALYACLATLAASGLLWLAAHFCWRPVTQFGEGVSPVEPWSMKLHGAATMLFLFLLGAMLNTHIRRAIRSRRNLATGWIVIGLIVFLVISAYGLYYLSGETARLIWSTVHWILGVVFAAGIVLHIFFGRRTIR